MRQLVDKILSGDLKEAGLELESKLSNLVKENIHQVKLDLISTMFVEEDEEEIFEEDELSEANIQKMGRTKLVRVRIRKGKVQRRKKLSNVKGYTIRGGRMVRMTSIERRHRKMAARKARFKRRGKMNQILRKRRISLRKRKAMGVR